MFCILNHQIKPVAHTQLSMVSGIPSLSMVECMYGPDRFKWQDGTLVHDPWVAVIGLVITIAVIMLI